jgi:hypothetical protein
MVNRAIRAPSVLLVQGHQIVDQLVWVLIGPDRKVHVNDPQAILGEIAVSSLLQ